MRPDQSVKLTDHLLDRIEGDAKIDPVAVQYVRSDLEDNHLGKETFDPIGDNKHSVCAGLIHREKNRVLFKITDICNIYCRFCFRKEMVGKGKGVLSDDEIKTAINYIKNNNIISEVILSGGDPLTLSNRRLKDLLTELDTIDHLDNIRIHTRTPMVKPDRIDKKLLQIFKSLKKPLYIVLHVNNAKEISHEVEEAFFNLHQSGAVLLSQSVLLKNVNDNIEALETLMRTLTKNRIKPYYLHHLDHAKGTEHFRVPIENGQALYRELKKRVSGISLPTYVLDIPGGYGKMPINSGYLELGIDNKHVILDNNDMQHIYHD